MSKANQHQQILNYMREHGAITKADGFSFGCTKVDTRISELRRAGYNITDEWASNKSGGRHKVYRLEETV